MKVEGPEIREGMQDNFRQWYMEHKKTHGKFPDFPTEEKWNTPEFSFLAAPTGTDGADVADAEGVGCYTSITDLYRRSVLILCFALIGKKSRGSSASSKVGAKKGEKKSEKKDTKGKGGDVRLSYWAKGRMQCCKPSYT